MAPFSFPKPVLKDDNGGDDSGSDGNVVGHSSDGGNDDKYDNGDGDFS